MGPKCSYELREVGPGPVRFIQSRCVTAHYSNIARVPFVGLERMNLYQCGFQETAMQY